MEMILLSVVVGLLILRVNHKYLQTDSYFNHKFRRIKANRNSRNIFESNAMPSNNFNQSLVRPFSKAKSNLDAYHKKSSIYSVEKLQAHCQHLNNYKKYRDIFSQPLRPNLYWWIIDKARSSSICLGPKSGSTQFQYFYQALNLTQEAYLYPGDDQKAREIRSKIDEKYTEAESLSKPTKIFGPEARNQVAEYLKRQDIQKIILVRHPLARLYSGFRDKFNPNKPEYKTKYLATASEINDKFMFASDDAPVEIQDSQTKQMVEYQVAFQSFLNYVVGKEEATLDPHFWTISKLCQLCKEGMKESVKFVVRQENMKYDMLSAFDKLIENSENPKDPFFLEFIKKKFFSSEASKQNNENLIGTIFQGYGDRYHEINDQQKIVHVQQLYRDIFGRNQTLANLIYSRFQLDFMLFGYTMEDYS